MNDVKLTKSETEIMSVLWEQKRPLSRTEILECSKDKAWKDSSIHILLNSMLDKGAIVVDGYIRTGKQYGRTYAPAFPMEEYWVSQLTQSHTFLNSKSSSIRKIMSALIDTDDANDETIRELEEMIAEKRRNRPLDEKESTADVMNE